MYSKAKLTAALFSSALIMFSMLPFSAGAETIETEEYKLETDGTETTIVRYMGDAEELEIPSEIEGHKITALGEKSFNMNGDLVSVVVPEGVTKIGERAFAIDSGIESITLPSTLTEIGVAAFEQCSSLKSVTYAGDETSWGAITIGETNDLLTAIAPDYVDAPSGDDSASSSEETASEETASEETASEETAIEETASEETASEETASEETASEETASEETASEETTGAETTGAETTGAVTDSASTAASSEATVPQGSGVNVPYMIGYIIIGVAVLDIIYFLINKPEPPRPYDLPENPNAPGTGRR